MDFTYNRCIVFLDPKSPAGLLYSNVEGECGTSIHNVTHYGLVCSSVDTGSPFAVRIVRWPKALNQAPQTLHIPNSSISLILEFPTDGPRPEGFIELGRK